MKPHRILKSFKGSQTGHDHHEFTAGTEAHLSHDLAAIVVKAGWAEPVGERMVVTSPLTGDTQTITFPEEKAIEAAPANKMLKSPANKGKK